MLISFFVSLAVLASGLFFIGPVIENSMSPGMANGFYILLRVIVMLGFSFIAVRRFHKNIYHALSFTGLLIFFDQIGVHSLWFAIQFRQHPADWQGMDFKTVLYNSAFSYIVFLPVILFISFLGAALGVYLREKQIKNSSST